LPFQCWHFGKYLVVTVPQLPSTIKAIYLERQEKKAEEERIQKEEEEEIQRREDEKREKKERKKEKRRNFAYDDKTEIIPWTPAAESQTDSAPDSPRRTLRPPQ